MARNDLLTIKVKDARKIRAMLKDMKRHMRKATVEDMLVEVCRILTPEVYVRHFGLDLELIVVGKKRKN